MFKDEILEIAENKIEPQTIGSINIYKSYDGKISLYWYSEDNEFEYVYSGNKTMFRWLKGKSYTNYCETPSIVKKLFNKIKGE